MTFKVYLPDYLVYVTTVIALYQIPLAHSACWSSYSGWSAWTCAPGGGFATAWIAKREKPTAACPSSNYLHASPGRSWHRCECRLLRLLFGHASIQHLHPAYHGPSQSSGRYVCHHCRRDSPLRERSTFCSTNTFPYGGAHAPFSRTTGSTSVPSFHSWIPAVRSAQACRNLLSSKRWRRR